MNFEEKFQQAQHLVGLKVAISGAPSRHDQTRKVVGTCVGVVKTATAGTVDIILKDGARYGLRLDEASKSVCSGNSLTLEPFIRTVRVVAPLQA